MELFIQAQNSLSVEQNILKILVAQAAYSPDANQVRKEAAEWGNNVYKITITVEQVEPKL